MAGPHHFIARITRICACVSRRKQQCRYIFFKQALASTRICRYEPDRARQAPTSKAERWLSGRKHRTRNAAYGQPYRGFESHPLRHASLLLHSVMLRDGRNSRWPPGRIVHPGTCPEMAIEVWRCARRQPGAVWRTYPAVARRCLHRLQFQLWCGSPSDTRRHQRELRESVAGPIDAGAMFPR